MLGIDCSLYYQSGGNYATPTWVEITCINDFSLNAAWDWAEVMSRASRVKVGAKTMLGLDFPCKLLPTYSGDAPYLAMRDAMIYDTIIDFMVLNGPTTQVGAWGFRFYGQVLQANQDHGPASRVMDDIIIRPTIPADSNWPKRAKVASGPTLEFSTIGGPAP